MSDAIPATTKTIETQTLTPPALLLLLLIVIIIVVNLNLILTISISYDNIANLMFFLAFALTVDSNLCFLELQTIRLIEIEITKAIFIDFFFTNFTFF